jgi:hypothetical protein
MLFIQNGKHAQVLKRPVDWPESRDPYKASTHKITIYGWSTRTRRRLLPVIFSSRRSREFSARSPCQLSLSHRRHLSIEQAAHPDALNRQ